MVNVGRSKYTFIVEKNLASARERIFEAATAEFAAYGIAGARVDRIAANARANKMLIYHHFGNKEALFSAVVGWQMQKMYDEVPVTPDDLPGYAVRLFDFAMAHPALMRLMAWSGLEQRAPVPHEQVDGTAAKLAGVAQAQATQRVQSTDSPAFILGVIVAIASSWAAGNPYATVIDPDLADHPLVYRESVRRAVARLCALGEA